MGSAEKRLPAPLSTSAADLRILGGEPRILRDVAKGRREAILGGGFRSPSYRASDTFGLPAATQSAGSAFTALPLLTAE
jgi:hypothetical protein